jgi:hypothetical protein
MKSPVSFVVAALVVFAGSAVSSVAAQPSFAPPSTGSDKGDPPPIPQKIPPPLALQSRYCVVPHFGYCPLPGAMIGSGCECLDENDRRRPGIAQ